MQAAIQAPRSARDAMFGDQSVQVNNIEVNLHSPRFFAQFGWETLHVDTNAIPNGYLLRGEITPCRSFRQKANIHEIREGDLIPGSEETDKDGRQSYGHYWKYGWYEAERLLNSENAGTHRNGLIEITTLSGVASEIYRKIDLNKLFYPDWPVLPEKHSDVKAMLEERISQIAHEPPDDIPAYWLVPILEIGQQLITAVNRADFVQRDRLTFTHSCMKLSPTDEGFKRQYDVVDYEMLKRTGLPQIHSAEIATAQALEKLTDRTDNGAVLELLKAQREQNEIMRKQAERQDQILELLLSERQSKEIKSTKK